MAGLEETAPPDHLTTSLGLPLAPVLDSSRLSGPPPPELTQAPLLCRHDMSKTKLSSPTFF